MQMRLTRCSVKACWSCTCCKSAWLLQLAFILLFLLFIFPCGYWANCISLIMCLRLGTCVLAQVPLLPRHQTLGTAHFLPWCRPSVTCTPRTLLAARLGAQWKAASVTHLGKQGKQQIPNHPIGIMPASMHLSLDACPLCFGRAELLHLFPVCYRPVYLTVVRRSRSLHWPLELFCTLCCFPLFPRN